MIDPEQLEARILLNDESLLVIDKPADVALLADRSGAENLWDALKATFGKLFLVHRLDKGTSGVLLLAKTQARQSELTRAFAQRDVRKFYLARIDGTMPSGTHLIDLPLKKGRKSRYRIAGRREDIRLEERTYRVQQDREGIAAVTRLRRLKGDWVVAQPKTGRTHQLRVHLSWIGLPILGDPLYGPRDNADRAPRLMLHCHKVIVPGDLSVSAPVPEAWSS